jgi:hypothetical protein
MLDWLKRIRATWSWARFAWQIAVVLGLSGAVSAIGGAVWAMIIGVPTPIAIMAGYCTLVGAIYLAMAPLAYRTLATPKQVETNFSRPDYQAWKMVSVLTIGEAAYLWCDIEPEQPGITIPAKVSGWLRAIIDSVMTGKLDFVLDRSRLQANTNTAAAKDYQKSHAEWQTKITRAELRRFAKEIGHVPIFLRD